MCAKLQALMVQPDLYGIGGALRLGWPASCGFYGCCKMHPTVVAWALPATGLAVSCSLHCGNGQRLLAIQAYRAAIAMASVPAAGTATKEADGPPAAANDTSATHAPTPSSMPVAADSSKPPVAASKPVAADSGKPPAAASKPMAADSVKPPAANSQAGSAPAAGTKHMKPTRTPAAQSAADTKSAGKAAAQAGGAKRPAASEAKSPQAKASASPPPAEKAALAADQHPQPASQAASEPPLWSEEQELALVQALKQVGKDVPDR